MPLTINNPDPMNDVLSAAGFRAARAAYRMGVFDTLRDGPLTAAETAVRLQADVRGIQILLGTLEVFGYVTHREGRYASSPMTAEWLVTEETGSFGAAFEFWGTVVFQLWDDLERSVREGKPPLDFYQWLEEHPPVQQNFQTMLRTIARNVAAEVVNTIELPPTARRLLDIGGSHAEYSLAFCGRYPELAATVFDFPGALQTGQEAIAARNMTGRIAMQPGNFLIDELPGGYDVALLMSVVHGHVPDRNIALLRNVAAALAPGGEVIILEQLSDSPTGTPDAFNRVFSLNLFHLQGGQTYSFDEIAAWLNEAGFSGVRRIDLGEASPDSLIVGRKAG